MNWFTYLILLASFSIALFLFNKKDPIFDGYTYDNIGNKKEKEQKIFIDTDSIKIENYSFDFLAQVFPSFEKFKSNDFKIENLREVPPTYYFDFRISSLKGTKSGVVHVRATYSEIEMNLIDLYEKDVSIHKKVILTKI